MPDVVRHMIRRIWDHLCHVTGTTTNQKQSKTTIFLQKEEETQLSFSKNIESDIPKTGVYHNNIWSAQLRELRV